jgi:ankyrin repeat protein
MLAAVEGFWNQQGELRPEAFKPEFRQQADGSWLPDPADLDEQRLISDSFYIACRNGHTEVARFLLGRGAEVDFRGFFGGTALHWAAGNGHRETVEFLLAAGARTDLGDEKFQATPRGWALHSGHGEIAELLAG